MRGNSAMTACNLSEWVVERIAEMKRRCPDVRVQGDDASMFEPYTADILEFVRRFGGLPQTPNMFLDPHPDFGGVSGWGGPPTILVPLAFGSEAVGTFLHEEGHWQCWFDQHTCRPWRRGVEIVNIAEGEICAETHALQELLCWGTRVVSEFGSSLTPAVTTQPQYASKGRHSGGFGSRIYGICVKRMLPDGNPRPENFWLVMAYGS